MIFGPQASSGPSKGSSDGKCAALNGSPTTNNHTLTINNDLHGERHPSLTFSISRDK